MQTNGIHRFCQSCLADEHVDVQAVNDFLQEKLEHVVAVLAPHATARPVADLLEAMAQGVSSFRMEHDMQVLETEI